jgi:hypothetical protein
MRSNTAMPLKGLGKGSTPLGKALVSGAVQARNRSRAQDLIPNGIRPSSRGLEGQMAPFSLLRGRLVGLGGVEPPTSSLSGTCAGMRSCWQRRRLPAHWWRGSDRGCPLGTEVVRPMWHAGGTVRPARLLASFRRGIPTWSRAARGYRRGMRAGAGTRDLGRGGREPAAAGRAGPYDPSRP